MQQRIAEASVFFVRNGFIFVIWLSGINATGCGYHTWLLPLSPLERDFFTPLGVFAPISCAA